MSRRVTVGGRTIGLVFNLQKARNAAIVFAVGLGLPAMPLCGCAAETDAVAYVADVQAAQRALDGGKTNEAERLLKQQVPAGNVKDLRGFEWRYLWRQCEGSPPQPPLREATAGLVPRNPDSRILILPDNHTLVAASPKAYVKLYDLNTLEATNEIIAARDPLYLTVNGRSLLTSGDGGLQIWDTRVRALAPLWIFPEGGDWSVSAFSPVDWIAAVRVGGGQVQVLDIGTVKPDKELGRFSAHTGTIRALAFAPDGKTLATAGTDKSAKLWDWAKQRNLASLDGHTATVTSLAFSPDGKTLASAGQDKAILLWDPASKSLKSRLEGHTGGVWSVAFSPDGRTLASASADNTIRLWSTAVAQPVLTLSPPEKADLGVMGLAFSPDGTVLAARLADGTLRVWRGTSIATNTAGHSSPSGKP